MMKFQTKKQLIITLAILLISTPAFAYYGYDSYRSYSYRNDDEEVYSIIMIVILAVWAVLNLILFFKIWGMTNDVKLLKQKMCDNIYADKSIKETILKLHLLGKDEKAFEKINDHIVSFIEALILDIKRVSYLPSGFDNASPKPSDFYANGQPVEDYFKEKMSALFNETAPLYKGIGREMPAHFSTLSLTELLNFGK